MKDEFNEPQYKNIVYDEIGKITNYDCDRFFYDKISKKLIETVEKGLKFNV